MFHLRTLIVAALLLLGGFSIGSCYSAGSHPVTQDRTAPTLQQIQMLAQLTTVRLDVADVQVSHLEGKLGGMSVALVLRAQIDIATDLTQARLEAIDPVHRTATLILPMPTAMPPRIDHEHSQVFGFDTRGLWRINPQDATYARGVNEAYRKVEQSLQETAGSKAMVEKAKGQAEAVINAFFQTLEFEISIIWTETAETRRQA